MSNFNRIIIMGNLTRDPEYKQLSSGTAVTRLGIASNRQYKNRQTGVLVQEVCFIDVDVFGPQADSCRQYLQKGRPVLVEGRLKFDTWQTSEGQTKSKHSILAERVVFLQSGNAANSVTSVASTEGDIMIESTAEVMPAAKASSSRASSRSSKASVASSETDIEPELGFKDEQPFSEELPF